MRITFKEIRYKNILSTGNVFTAIPLDSHATTLIRGVNGAGKSTMIDALHFVLFNGAYRNITKPALVNSINKKELLVEVDFVIGKTEYTVRRGIKPNIFEIIRDGSPLDQMAKATDTQAYLENEIIKMDSTTFKQIVVMGTANYVPFMLLKTPQRRAIVEELLDIQVIGLLAGALSKDVTANKKAITDTDANLRVATNQIEQAQSYNAKLRQAEARSREVFEEAIAKANTEIAFLNERKLGFLEKLPKIEKALAEIEKLEVLRQDQEKAKYPLSAERDQLMKTAKFFLHHDNCPTCKQGIGHDAKAIGADHQAQADAVLEKIEKLNKRISMINEKIATIPDARTALQAVNRKVSEIDSQVRVQEGTIASNKKQIEDSNKSFEYIDNAQIMVYQDERSKLEVAFNELTLDREAFGVLTSAFKDDGVKTIVIAKYIPIINELINRYLSILDFFVEFELNESFEETIKSRHRDVFTFESFSEGEKAKISTAILFTWRKLTKMRNSTSTNLLILDEVFDGSMDSGATSGLMKILLDETSDGGTNCFVISHKSDGDMSEFDRYLKFDKQKNFSVLL